MPLPCCKEKWPQIPDDEPVFVIRGKDLLAVPAIRYWMLLASKAGVNPEKMGAVEYHLDAVEKFQAEHPERCKIPD